MKNFLIHYGEIALKNRNRSQFENSLKNRIERRCKQIAPCSVRKLPGRFLLEFAAPPPMKEVKDKLSKIFGVANFIPCGIAEPTIEALRANIEKELTSRDVRSFAVRAKRADKNFPVSSQFVNENIGAFVKEKTGATVNLKHPETTVTIELFSDKIFYGFEKLPGLGGIPVGTAGRVACLLSGGIDSPVAAWRMMKRGCENIYIHFHSAPFTSKDSEEKALDLAEALSAYQEESLFISVPFGEIQREIVAKTPEAYRVLLYRRLMVRIAEHLAKEHGAPALVTGESLSQVASQTLSNITAIDHVSNLPILRPLIGMDKNEIIETAREIGTFEISIRPHTDCCGFMIPKRPKTRSRIADLNTIETYLEIDALVEKGVKESRVIRV